MNLLELTKEIWNLYFLGAAQTNLQMMDLLDPGCVVIGTGQHEFYTNVQDFATAMAMEMAERQDIQFQLRNLECKEKVISPEVSLVYGTIHVWWESDDHRVCINMNGRFTLLYKRVDGHWKIFHIHLSTPNVDQLDGEYYPKSLREQIEQSQEQIETLSKLAQHDSLTGLMNYRTFEERYAELGKHAAWLFVIDLDNFKQINDTYGHLTGNVVLQKLSRVLTSALRSDDLVCRMGGDEFVLLCSGLPTQEKAQHLAQRLLQQVAGCGKEVDAWTSISMGITPVNPNEPLESAFKRADAALYDAKKQGKNRYAVSL